MTVLNTQEMSIIKAFSSSHVPERVMRESNIKELIRDMTVEQDAVQSNSERLESLRKEKKDGNFVGNWWHDRDDKVQDAQLDLNKSIGRLTQKSSQLLIVNTVISKVLNDQQRILLEQQTMLKSQTDTLEEQNRQILRQQNLLEKQQHDINQANQGLLEAKGITQEQAQQLVGCVKMVKEAESRISSASHALKRDVDKSLEEAIEHSAKQLDDAVAKQENRQGTFEKQLLDQLTTFSQQIQDELQQTIAEAIENRVAVQEQLTAFVATLQQHKETLEQQFQQALSSHDHHIQSEFEHITAENSAVQTSIEQRLQTHSKAVLEKLSYQETVTQQQHQTIKLTENRLDRVQNEHHQRLEDAKAQQLSQLKAANRHRLMTALVATLSLLSLSWQAALYFGLVH